MNKRYIKPSIKSYGITLCDIVCGSELVRGEAVEDVVGDTKERGIWGDL